MKHHLHHGFRRGDVVLQHPFLRHADGAHAIKPDTVSKLGIELIKKYLPNTKVITMYARTDNIASKSDEDLKAFRKAGVDDLYIGVECGLNDV